jgi:hypothetical protein
MRMIPSRFNKASTRCSDAAKLTHRLLVAWLLFVALVQISVEFAILPARTFFKR